MKRMMVIVIGLFVFLSFISNSEAKVVKKVAKIEKDGELISTDTGTHGNWKGRYGKEGAIIIGDSEAKPKFLKEFVHSNTSAFTWAEKTDEVRGLMRESSESRLASCWYSDKIMEFKVIPESSRPFVLTMYFLDWDSNARVQSIELLNLKNDSILSKKDIREFKDGVYLSWRIVGPVKIRISNMGPSNGVVSGIFFEPALKK